MSTTLAHKPFVISRTFNASREAVFDAFTRPEAINRWWGPKGFTVITSNMDLRPGGRYHYGMRAPNGMEMWGKSVYREIVRPERLVFVNSFSDADGGISRHPMSPDWPLELFSTLIFEDVGGRTKLTITWVPINPTEKERVTFDGGHDSMKQGWTGTLDQLEGYLAKA